MKCPDHVNHKNQVHASHKSDDGFIYYFNSLENTLVKKIEKLLFISINPHFIGHLRYAAGGDRTLDITVFSRALSQLSYRGKKKI